MLLLSLGLGAGAGLGGGLPYVICSGGIPLCRGGELLLGLSLGDVHLRGGLGCVFPIRPGCGLVKVTGGGASEGGGSRGDRVSQASIRERLRRGHDDMALASAAG